MEAHFTRKVGHYFLSIIKTHLKLRVGQRLNNNPVFFGFIYFHYSVVDMLASLLGNVNCNLNLVQIIGYASDPKWRQQYPR